MSSLASDEEKTLRTYEKYGDVWVRNNNTRDFWLSYMKKLWSYVPGGKVLDVGCAGGRDAECLIELGYDYTGIDAAKTFIKIAKKRLPGHRFYQQSLYDLSLPDKFDAFWIAAVLLHVPKSRINAALTSIKSVLKPKASGFIAIKDGGGEGLQTDRLEDTELERFFSYWSKDEFAKVLKLNGFGVLEYDYWPVSEKTRWHCFFVRLS